MIPLKLFPSIGKLYTLCFLMLILSTHPVWSQITEAQCAYSLTENESPESLEKQNKPVKNQPGQFFKVLFVFVQFKEDNDPYSSWEPGQLPTWAGDLVDPVPSSSYRPFSLSKYWKDMSYGQFDFIGDIYGPVILNKTKAQYQSENKNYGEINKEIIAQIDPIINFDTYDNWKFNTGTNQWEFAKDGYVDMIYIIYRNAPYTEGWFTTFDGGRLAGVAALGKWIGDLTTQDAGVKVNSNIKDINPYGKITFEDYIGSGITITKAEANSSLEMLSILNHEFGHYVFGYTHTFHSIGLMANEPENRVLGLTGIEQVQLGYLNYTNILSSNSSLTLTDALTTAKVYRIPVPLNNPNSSSFFLIENHQRISEWDVPIRGGALMGGYGTGNQIGSGVYIYLVKNGTIFNSNILFSNRCADGAWNWKWVGESVYSNGTPDWAVGLDLMVRTSPNRNSIETDRYDMITQQNNYDPAYSKFKTGINWFDINPLTKEWNLTNDMMGDEYDAFTLSGNNLFSPWSNPSSWLDGETGIAVQLTGQTLRPAEDGFDIHVKITVTSAESQALIPSRPQQLKVTIENGKPKLNWSPNIEPDLASYKIYRAITTGTTAPSTYTYQTTVSSTVNEWLDAGYTYPGSGTQRVFYKITAIDNQTPAKESAKSDFDYTEFSPAITLTIDQKVNTVSRGQVRIKTGTSAIRIDEGTLQTVPYTNTFSSNTYSFISVDEPSENRFFNNWVVDPILQSTEFNYINTKTIDSKTKDQTAIQSNPVTFTPTFSLDGVNLSGQFKLIDPWFVNSSFQQVPGFEKVVIGSTKVFTDQQPDEVKPETPFYKVKKATEWNGIPIYFQNWSGNTIPSASTILPGEYPIIFNNPASTTIASYKGHLITSQSQSTFAKNQRRMVLGKNPDNIAFVYESAGDIWLTFSSNGGVTWGNEQRISSGNSLASNPCISNAVNFTPGDFDKIAITWVENGELITILASFDSAPKWGWDLTKAISTPFETTIRTTKTLFSGVLPMADAHPFINLERVFSSGAFSVKISIAFEAQAKPTLSEIGVVFGSLELNGNFITYSGQVQMGSVSNFDLSKVGTYSFLDLSTDLKNKFPIIVKESEIFNAKKAIYFLCSTTATNGNDGTPLFSKLMEYNINTGALNQLTIPSYFKGYKYITGAVNFGSSAFVLVAGGWFGDIYHWTDQRYDIPSTFVYTKASTAASTTVPQLFSVYWGNYNPLVMADQSPVTGQPVYEIYYKTNTSGYWMKTTGTNTVSTVSVPSVVYPILAERVPSGNRKTILTTPFNGFGKFSTYTGTTLLSKSSEDGSKIADVKLWRTIESATNGTFSTIQLNFSGSVASTNRSLEGNRILAVVTIDQLSSEGLIVTREDSIETPLGVEIERNDEVILAFSASRWNLLDHANLNQLQAGDKIRFVLPSCYYLSSGYDEYAFNPESMFNKQSEQEKDGEQLTKLKLAVKPYPNPFNPATNLKLTLPSNSSDISFEIFNMLGQRVKVLYNGQLDAGEHNFQFNGSSFATGVYLYRVQIGKKVLTGKLLLVK